MKDWIFLEGTQFCKAENTWIALFQLPRPRILPVSKWLPESSTFSVIVCKNCEMDETSLAIRRVVQEPDLDSFKVDSAYM